MIMNPPWCQNSTEVLAGLSVRRYQRYLLIVIAVVSCLWLVSRPYHIFHTGPYRFDIGSSAYFSSQAASSHPPPSSHSAKTFWNELTQAIADGEPDVPAITRKEQGELWVLFDRFKKEDTRPSRLDQIEQKDVEKLKKVHAETLARMQTLAATLPMAKGTRGIAMTASREGMSILVTSLVMLRQSGSRLPVEVWLKDRSDYDPLPCDDVLPRFNARCMFMIDYLPNAMEHPLRPTSYVYKTLAIIFSTFEQVLFLDDDDFPVTNPDSIFETEPFTSHGMVTWPDFWQSIASPLLYEIVGVPLPDTRWRATGESGQLLVNKATHAAALLMVQYYNIWGKTHWYPLLYQGGPGEGDKDTFVLAAQTTNSSFYHVRTPPERLGYRCEGETRSIAYAQSHPLDDWRLDSKGLRLPQSPDMLQLGDAIHPRALFVHANMPKLEAHILLLFAEETEVWKDLLRCDKGTGAPHYLLGDKELSTMRFGWDVERAIWDAVRWTACEHGEAFPVWRQATLIRPKVRENICRDIVAVWETLFPGRAWNGLEIAASRAERPWRGLKYASSSSTSS